MFIGHFAIAHIQHYQEDHISPRAVSAYLVARPRHSISAGTDIGTFRGGCVGGLKYARGPGSVPVPIQPGAIGTAAVPPGLER
jgi:hypothetical protein